MNIMKGERIAFFSHFFGALTALAGTVTLIIISLGNKTLLMTSLIYGLSITFLFSASSLYHAKKRGENEVTFWRKLDHLAIFVMIAGSYTPICFFYLEGPMFWGILIAQWSLVFLGILFKFWFLNAPRFLNIAIYLAMGWMAIIPMGTIFDVMPRAEIHYLFAGAFSFTAGAIIYLLKKPNFFRGSFGFHELFHFFILLGGVMHYIMILRGTVGILSI